jgi:16S rRNA (guanine1207-N2)-methyltransferase
MTADHYFTAEPSSADIERRTVRFTVLDREFALATAGGVFSPGRLDSGTAVLLHKAPLPGADAVGPLLDLGCGYGPIAVVLAAAAPDATVYAVDVNQRALELTRHNTSGSKVVAGTPDEVPPDVRFAQIWSNPPIRVGKEELHALLDRWLPRLLPDGVAWLVVARHLGGDSLQKWLAERGWTVARHASQKGYRVFQVRKTPGSGEDVTSWDM